MSEPCRTMQYAPYNYAPNGLSQGPYIMRDTGGIEVEVTLLDRDATPGELNFFGRAVSMPDTHEKVYDVGMNHWALARKLVPERRVLVEFTFTNESELRVLEALRTVSSFRAMRDLPSGATVEIRRFTEGAD